MLDELHRFLEVRGKQYRYFMCVKPEPVMVCKSVFNEMEEDLLIHGIVPSGYKI